MNKLGFIIAEISDNGVHFLTKSVTGIDHEVSYKVHRGNLHILFRLFVKNEKVIEYRWMITSNEEKRRIEYIIRNSNPLAIDFPLNSAEDHLLLKSVSKELEIMLKTGELGLCEPQTFDRNSEDFEVIVFGMNTDNLFSLIEKLTRERFSKFHQMKLLKESAITAKAFSTGVELQWELQMSKRQVTDFIVETMTPIYANRKCPLIVYSTWSDCSNHAK